MSRRKKIYLNAGTSILNQIVVIVCNFILPRHILLCFGSDVNGLITSLTRFLSVITFLELGLGPVIQSNLYKPLARKDNNTISKIIISAEKFYRKIAYIFLGYIFVLSIIFPILTPKFDFWFTTSLLLIISISTFSQYYFGITYQVLLNADQRVYVSSTINIITTIINTILCVILMKIGCGIHIVKLISTIVFVFRPILLNYYVKINYKIDKNITYTKEPIKQKWNGFAQHLASVVCNEIDVVLLTIFGTYQNVSVYSIYFLIINGITNLILMSAQGLESLWGNMIAKKENSLLLKTFESVESLFHILVTFMFTCTAILITSFVKVYVSGLDDAISYILPAFGYILTFAFAFLCLRIPYFRVIKAAGHFKETQNGAFISMGINIFVSICLVLKFNLIGVAIGTLLAMIYHTVYFVLYLKNNIINRDPIHFFKHLLLDIIIVIICFILTKDLFMTNITYISWIIYAIKIFCIVFPITVILNYLFYKESLKYILNKIFKKKEKKIK